MSKYDADGNLLEEGGGIRVIKYIEYHLLEKIIGRDHLRNLIHIKNIVTINGELDMEEIERIRATTPKHKYYHIGIEKFYEMYDEILSYRHIRNRDGVAE